MKLTHYKITDEERKKAEEILSRKIPHIAGRVDYDDYFAEYLSVEQLAVLCKYFACNIVELAREVRNYKETYK